MYQALGVSTNRRGKGRNASVPYELGVRVDADIAINKSKQQLYRFWRNLENLPRFMGHLESVKEIDNKHSHWVAKAPAGRSVQWKAEIINEVEDELIAWRSLRGSDVDNAGSVQFKSAPNGETIVQIELHITRRAAPWERWWRSCSEKNRRSRSRKICANSRR